MTATEIADAIEKARDKLCEGRTLLQEMQTKYDKGIRVHLEKDILITTGHAQNIIDSAEFELKNLQIEYLKSKGIF